MNSQLHTYSFYGAHHSKQNVFCFIARFLIFWCTPSAVQKLSTHGRCTSYHEPMRNTPAIKRIQMNNNMLEYLPDVPLTDASRLAPELCKCIYSSANVWFRPQQGTYILIQCHRLCCNQLRFLLVAVIQLCPTKMRARHRLYRSPTRHKRITAPHNRILHWRLSNSELQTYTHTRQKNLYDFRTAANRPAIVEPHRQYSLRRGVVQ